MLILLPPSEGKTSPASGSGFDPSALRFADDAAVRAGRDEMLARLAEVSARKDALELLGVGASLTHEVAANRHLASAPAAAGHRVYTGVLFDALDYASLPERARHRARRQTLVFSALFGVTGLGDRIPAYRLPIGARLPETPGLAAWWRPRLTPALDAAAEQDDGPVVDCRSGGYAAQWKAPAHRTVTVDVFQLRNGTPKVVSHFAKHTRGLVARALLQAPARSTRSLEAVAEVVRAHPAAPVAEDGTAPADGAARWHVELVEPTGAKPGSLRITLPET